MNKKQISAKERLKRSLKGSSEAGTAKQEIDEGKEIFEEAGGARLELAISEKIKLLPRILQTSRSDKELEMAAELINGKTLIEVLKDQQIAKDALYDWLTRGPFSERLQKFKDAGAADLFSSAFLMARGGNERMLEMLLPALSEELDSGIRREKARTSGAAANQIIAKLLDMEPPKLTKGDEE